MFLWKKVLNWSAFSSKLSSYQHFLSILNSYQHFSLYPDQVYIRDCTMVNMYPLLLFGGGSISVDLEKGNFVLTIDDGWIRFMADSTKVLILLFSYISK